MKLSKATLEYLRKKYPKDTTVKLIRMDDKYAPLIGTLGTVQFVDDIGSIHVNWDNGSTLAVLYDEDEIIKV